MAEQLLGGSNVCSTHCKARLLRAALLERCVAAEPAIHYAHYWPVTPYQLGFRYETEVEQARSWLTNGLAKEKAADE